MVEQSAVEPFDAELSADGKSDGALNNRDHNMLFREKVILRLPIM
jgi:hypothetical protein